ncbi:hypothetical protein [Phytohabitans rumicis]|uniref:DUF4244 domain-containing protein n=1 Tax=Phytohabitans rumicis TaxID=1076125 RepID=A0A6V8LFA8_9ACTN|nr:hypothetical protein [Phytohabitans rumicis]GFJ93299.1 hypothetical protein Prum_069410 [Phytohabitans rumicis]
MRTVIRAVVARLNTAIQGRIAQARREPDRGSHAVEYAIGIAAGAGVIIGLYASYKSGVAGVVQGWVLK